MMWSEAALSVWGKTNRDDHTWFPVVHHLTDSAAMAGELFDHYLPDGARMGLVSMTGLPIDQLRQLVCFLAGVHDVGKVTPQFCSQAKHGFEELLAGMARHGLTAQAHPDKPQHATMGQVILTDWLVAQSGVNRRLAGSYASVIGGHHGRNPTSATLRSVQASPTALGTGRWAEVQAEVLDGIAAHTGADVHWVDWLARPLPAAAQSLLTGLVIMSDWMASNIDYFPYDAILTTPARLDRARKALDLPRPWAPEDWGPDADPTSLLQQRFPQLTGRPARSIQAELIAAAHACAEPPLLIVEAPMGVGKTEAALLAAEVLASRFGQGGVFLGLPTMATANPMFTRTLDWLDATLTQDASVALTHGKAGLNDCYAALIGDAWRGQVYEEDGTDVGRAVVNLWLRGAKRAGLASFVIGTIDQALFSALKAKHVSLRHLGLASKVVILDEVHSADTYMRVYLTRLLTWLSAIRVPVILMSATLPPAQRAEFVAAYARGRGDKRPDAPDPSDTYPRITAYDGATRSLAVAREGVPTEVGLERLPDDLATLTTTLSGLLDEGGCAGVVCNTVRRAQEAYDALAERFGADAVVLTHSRFLAPDRLAREADLVDRLGRDGDRRPDRLIVVGTQVLEQSLDIDFDVLISDLAPADLLLQRVGRLHRHERTGRPSAVARPRLLVRGVDDWSAMPPAPSRSGRAIYGASALLRCLAVLSGRTGLRLPEDIPVLVRTAYDPEATPPSGWQEDWAAAEARASLDEACSRSRAGSYLLADPTKMSSLDGWIDVDGGDPERAEAQGHAQVRDSEDTIEVIAVTRIGDELFLPACASLPNAPIPLGQLGTSGDDAALARSLAACTLRLPRELCHEGIVGPLIDALESMIDTSGWQESPWLRGQLVLPFDAHGNAEFSTGVRGGLHTVTHHLHYDSLRGLTVEHVKER